MNLMPFDIPLSIVLAFGVAVGLCLVMALAHLLTRDSKLQVDPEWAMQLSSEHYRPMLRLLSEDDIDFLRRQPGYQPSMSAKLRTQRCLILKSYLRSLDLDFRSLCVAIKALMVQSHQDRPDLARALYLYKVRFAVSIMSVRIRMMFYRLGVGTVDLAGLMDLFDVTRARLRDLTPAVMAAGL